MKKRRASVSGVSEARSAASSCLEISTFDVTPVVAAEFDKYNKAQCGTAVILSDTFPHEDASHAYHKETAESFRMYT